MTGIDEITKPKIIKTVMAIIPDAKVILYSSRAAGCIEGNELKFL